VIQSKGVAVTISLATYFSHLNPTFQWWRRNYYYYEKFQRTTSLTEIRIWWTISQSPSVGLYTLICKPIGYSYSLHLCMCGCEGVVSCNRGNYSWSSSSSSSLLYCCSLHPKSWHELDWKRRSSLLLLRWREGSFIDNLENSSDSHFVQKTTFCFISRRDWVNLAFNLSATRSCSSRPTYFVRMHNDETNSSRPSIDCK